MFVLGVGAQFGRGGLRLVVGNESGLNLLGSVRIVFGGGGSTTHDWKWLILFGWYYVIVKRRGREW